MKNEIPHRELPEASQYLPHWEMTESQIQIVNLAASLRGYGVDICFESDEISEAGIRFMKRLNDFISLMDGHALDAAVAIQEARAA